MIQKLDFNWDLVKAYIHVFPLNECSNLDTYKASMNGVFQDQAEWWGFKNDQGQIIAFVTVGTTPDRSFVYNVGVAKAYRGQGYGIKMVQHIIQVYGHKNLFLFVAKDNRPALSLYRKFHFEYMEKAYQPPPGEVCLARFK